MENGQDGVRKQGGAFIGVGAFIEELIPYCEYLQNDLGKISTVHKCKHLWCTTVLELNILYKVP